VINLLSSLAHPFLMLLEPERAHRATIAALSLLPPAAPPVAPRALAIDAFGLRFPHPLGMAPGFDKGGEVIDALFGLGFGFVEIGTVTPLPQSGNPQPRLFRVPEDEGVINRFGFNSEGAACVLERLKKRAKNGLLGVNVGANKTSADRSGDYVSGIYHFAEVADYFTVNISSPNTPGLRDLQQASALNELLGRVLEARDEISLRGGRKPILLKIAPDLTLGDLDDIVHVARARGIDGMIISNTTIARPKNLRSKKAQSIEGGLSGKPLFPASTYILAQTFLRVERQFPLIGVGGIHDVETAFAKMEAGASLIQLYSALVYHGPRLISTITKGLAERVHSEGFAHINAIIGRKAHEWAQRTPQI
jgi:dihydroorotate dehydrogenase